MKVNSLNTTILPTKPVENTERQKKVSKEKFDDRDTIQISAEAQQMHASKTNGKDLEVIKTKIEEKFYNSDEIINSVADAILKELKSS